MRTQKNITYSFAWNFVGSQARKGCSFSYMSCDINYTVLEKGQYPFPSSDRLHRACPDGAKIGEKAPVAPFPQSSPHCHKGSGGAYPFSSRF